jgi:hypothetical protein
VGFRFQVQHCISFRVQMIHGGSVSRIPFNRTPRNHEFGISEGSRVVADHQGDVPLCVFLRGEGDRRHLPLVLLLAVFAWRSSCPYYTILGWGCKQEKEILWDFLAS